MGVLFDGERLRLHEICARERKIGNPRLKNKHSFTFDKKAAKIKFLWLFMSCHAISKTSHKKLIFDNLLPDQVKFV